MEVKKHLLAGSTLVVSMVVAGYVQAAPDLVSGGIANTRHNLTQSYSPAVSGAMASVRNDYGEVCVYCHTPHGANVSTGAGMPLWNRTVDATLSYELYAKPTMGLGADQNVTHPGPASLTCLSCHDGVTAIDSIINMPGGGGYNKDQESGASDTAWLSSAWTAQGGTPSTVHSSLSTPGCISCHREAVLGGLLGDAYNFEIFSIGNSFSYTPGSKTFMESNTVDLRDDHPVGVLYPTTIEPGIDFNPMDVSIPGRYAFFDNGNGRADKGEIRVYDSGDGFEVECASCHDPHGVADSAGTKFIPSFLRVENVDSGLCLACHDK